MSWAPNDLVMDDDLVAYEANILTQFGASEWQTRRQKALEDWLFPLLASRNFDPDRFRTRFVPSAVYGYTSGSFSDLTATAQNSEGLVLSTILPTASDALYVGYPSAFRGLSVRMLANVNAAALALTTAVWADSWQTVAVDNETVTTVPLAKGGAITWAVPEGLVRRTLNNSSLAYWARLSVSAVPTTGTAIGPLLVIRRSRLAAAVTMRTLALIFREAPTSQDGPWDQKALWYETEADRAFERVVGAIGGEFDTDNSDAIDATEAAQTAASVNAGGWTLERG